MGNKISFCFETLNRGRKHLVKDLTSISDSNDVSFPFELGSLNQPRVLSVQKVLRLAVPLSRYHVEFGTLGRHNDHVNSVLGAGKHDSFAIVLEFFVLDRCITRGQINKIDVDIIEFIFPSHLTGHAHYVQDIINVKLLPMHRVRIDTVDIVTHIVVKVTNRVDKRRRRLNSDNFVVVLYATARKDCLFEALGSVLVANQEDLSVHQVVHQNVTLVSSFAGNF